MSSDIIVVKSNHFSGEKSAKFSNRPFQDICDKLHEVASLSRNLALAEIAKNAKLDDYLDLEYLDDKGRKLFQVVIKDILNDPFFFSWHSSWRTNPIFIERCKNYGITTDAELSKMRCETIKELNNLLNMIS